MVDGLLPGRTGRSWISDATGSTCAIHDGTGANPVEIVIPASPARQADRTLRRLYRERRASGADPVLVVGHATGAAVDVCGPQIDVWGPTVERGAVTREVHAEPIARVCATVLDFEDERRARRHLAEALERLEGGHLSVRNRGLLSHRAIAELPDGDAWADATESVESLLCATGRQLVSGLGYEVDDVDDATSLLRDEAEGRPVAVGTFLDGEESFEARPAKTGREPVAAALREADWRGIEHVIACSGATLRRYATNPATKVGHCGRTGTYVEVDVDSLSADRAGYLRLLFGATALVEGGSVADLGHRSRVHATELEDRLRRRSAEEALPSLATAIADAHARPASEGRARDLPFRTARSLIVGLLFVGAAEANELLPRRSSPEYARRSLARTVADVRDVVHEGGDFDDDATTYWDDVTTSLRAIREGRPAWGLPACESPLFSPDPGPTGTGAAVSRISLTDAQFGPVLATLFLEETVANRPRPIDLRDLDVDAFGALYQELLGVESASGGRLPAPGGSEDRRLATSLDAASVDWNLAEADATHCSGLSGDRKATGTYYTDRRFVRHLLDTALEPALESHFARLDGMTDEDAADHFFDVRVADVAMGTGRFLLAAVDRIERRLASYLADRPLPGVERELDRLRERVTDSASAAPGVVGRRRLLRRQVARRCLYGVDRDPSAVALCRLATWAHTFVPGRGPSTLEHALRTGDSLAGIGTVDAARERLEATRTSADAEPEERIDAAIAEAGRLADAGAAAGLDGRTVRANVDERLAETSATLDDLAASRIDDDVDPATTGHDAVEDSSGDGADWKSAGDGADWKSAGDGAGARPDESGVSGPLDCVSGPGGPLHFPAAFPAVFARDEPGFDAVLGNPPWEKAKVERHAFWARRVPGIRGRSQGELEAAIERLAASNPELVRELERVRADQRRRTAILNAGPYPGTGAGDPDLYQAFCWRFWQLCRAGGTVGAVVPREAFTQKGSEAFRREVFENGTVLDATFLGNDGGWVFDGVHRQYTVALASVAKREPGSDATVPIRGPFVDPGAFDAGRRREPTRFPVAAVERWTDVAALPLLPSERTAIEAFERLQSHPRIDADRPDQWRVVPYRSGVTAGDCVADQDAVAGEAWPVYKGASFDVWNPDTGTYYGWASRDALVEHLHDRRAASRKWPAVCETLPCFRPTVAFRRVTNRTNRRTVVAALVPPRVVVRDADPFLLWPRGDETDRAYVLGVLSSIPLDWYARRFVEKHLDYYVFDGLPVPRPGRANPLRRRVVALAGRLAAADDRYADWADAVGVDCGPLPADERRRRVHELDAVVAHLYGLDRDHLRAVFETFHDNWNHEPRMNAVLDHYDRWVRRIDRRSSETGRR